MRAASLCFAFLLTLLGTTSQGAEVTYTGSSERDPFAALFKKRGTLEDVEASESLLRAMTVQGIVAYSDNPRAIINGKIYRVGDEPASGAKITKIVKEGVFITSGEKEILLSRRTPTTRGKNR